MIEIKNSFNLLLSISGYLAKRKEELGSSGKLYFVFCFLYILTVSV